MFYLWEIIEGTRKDLLQELAEHWTINTEWQHCSKNNKNIVKTQTFFLKVKSCPNWGKVMEAYSQGLPLWLAPYKQRIFGVVFYKEDNLLVKGRQIQETWRLPPLTEFKVNQDGVKFL